MNDKLDMQSVDFTSLNTEKIAALFPNCVTETHDGKKIDFDLLKQELSADIVDGSKERYRLEWPGKREAIVTANLPTNKTLRPVREDSVDFDNTENLYIEGDNLEVLKLLQESYLGKIKMIYIDPPYNTGKDFVYKDNFSKEGGTELFESGQKNEYNEKLVANPETSGRYHSDWLTMMYPRLKLARNLLTEDGVIFISIDDNEMHNLRKMCDEIFGEINFIAELIHKNNSNKNQTNFIGVSTESVLVVSKNYEILKQNAQWRIPKKGSADIVNFFADAVKKGRDLQEILDDIKDLYKRPKYSHLSRWNKIDEKGVFKDENISREGGPKNFTIINPNTGKECKIPPRGWGKSYEDLLKLQEEDMIYYGEEDSVPGIKYYLEKDTVSVPDNFWYFDNSIDVRWLKSQFGSYVFDNPKPVEMIKQMVSLNTSSKDIILDFFSGSATTAHAVMQLNAEDGQNRKFIMVQIPENTNEKSVGFLAGFNTITDIAKERIKKAAIFLQSNKTNQKKVEENDKSSKTRLSHVTDNPDYGFRVYRLDSSNMKDVYYKPQDFTPSLLDALEDNVKEDRTAEDLVTQVMLDWGLPLSLKIERKTIARKEVFAVAGDSLYCCFAEGVDEAFAKEVAKEKPLRIVFRDRGFASDTAKTNVKQLLKQLSPETEMKVL